MSISLDRPIGASGALVLVTLLYEMARRNAKRCVPRSVWEAGMPWRLRSNELGTEKKSEETR